MRKIYFIGILFIFYNCTIAQSLLPYNDNGLCFGKPDTFGLAKAKTSRAAIGDFNSDGKKDIAYYQYTNQQIFILYNTGQTFTVGAMFNFPYTLDLTAGDLDGDGDADIVALTNNTLTILDNTTPAFSNTFQKNVVTNTVNFSSIQVMLLESDDIDNDGREEIITRGYNATGLNMSIIKCSPSFTSVIAGASFYALTSGGLNANTNEWTYSVGDKDGDGNKEFAVAIGSFNSGPIVTYSTSVTANFVSYLGGPNTGFNVYSLLMEDANNDSKADLFYVIGNTIQNLQINAAPNYTSIIGSTTGSGNGRTFSFYKDFNNDGYKDFLGYDLQSNILKINLGLPSVNQFSVQTTPILLAATGGSVLPRHCLSEDFNNDGLPDILFIGYNQTVDFGPAILYNRSYKFNINQTPVAIQCAGETYTFTTTFTNTPYSMFWYYPGITSTSITTNSVATIYSKATYTVPIKEGASTCTVLSSNSLTASFVPSPTLNVSQSPNISCAGNPINLSVTGAISYTFNNTLINTLGNYSFTPSSTGNVTVTGINTNNCKSTVIYSSNIAPNPAYQISISDSIICYGKTSNVIYTSSASVNYTTQPGNLNNSTISLNPLITTIYTVTASNQTNNCASSQTLQIKVVPNPTVIVFPTDTTICSNEKIDFKLQGALTYSFNSSPILNSSYADYFSSQTNLLFEGSNQFGCKAFASSTVNIHPISTNSLIASSEKVCIGDSVYLSVENSTLVTWSTGQISQSISVKPIISTLYFAIFEDKNSCSYTRSVTIDIDSDCNLNPHNVITSNNDGVNDVFIIDNITKFPKNQVSLYNRWGLLLKEIKNYDNKERVWPNGNNITEGTYFYVIEVEVQNNTTIKKGWIEIIK